MVSIQDPRRQKVLEIIQSPDYTPEEAADLIFEVVQQPKPMLKGIEHPSFKARINRDGWRQSRVLEVLRKSGRAMTRAEVAEVLGDMTPAGLAKVSTALIRMSERGIVVRTRNSDRELNAGVKKGVAPSRYELADDV